ncbi:MAG: cyclopropane fatty acyl phospholipid synthase [Opitutales bacterium]
MLSGLFRQGVVDRRYDRRLREILEGADIRLNGDRPWDIQVHDERFAARILALGSLGLGESYMDGWWDCAALDAMVMRLLRTDLGAEFRPVRDLWNILSAKLVNWQKGRRAYRIGEEHYDLGEDLFEAMLGRYRIYSCGYWRKADNVDDAQAAKVDLIARKLGIRAGMTVLDLGCGWGETAHYLARHYGAQVTGLTVSRNQAEYARTYCKDLPVEIHLRDYRDINGIFDRVISVGMFEHVGRKNYATFMDVCRRCLKDDGLCLLHTIGTQMPSPRPDPWISKYIFPNSILPGALDIVRTATRRFVIEDWHNFGADYDRTLMAWHRSFEKAWPRLKKHYSERFYRMWRYYLLACAGSFRARHIHLWQITLSPHGVPGGHRSVR